jgi:DNA-binding LacI/PurR family transcriptional regulator
MATIIDVAKAAGVSKSTVSRVFTGSDSVSPIALQKVIQAAETFNYTPNAIARAMITKRTENIGFIIYDLQAPAIINPFYGPVLESVIEHIGKKGYSLFISSDKGLKNSSGERMLRKRVDGVILASQTSPKIAGNFIHKEIPVVLINYRLDMKGAYSILSDDAGGIMSAVRYLAKAGHRDIGFIEGRFTRFIFKRRHQGFVDAMKNADLTAHAAFNAETEATIQDAFASVYALLKGRKHPSALLCTNDVVAVGAVKAALRRGLRVPDDISVVGYDNSELCAACEPALTSIDPNTWELGALAVDCLLRQIDGERPRQTAATVKTRLVERESVAMR